MLTRTLGDADIAIASGDLLGETPFWSRTENALYWVDIRSHSIQRWQEATGEHRRWTMPEICTGIVPAEDGGLIVALTNRLAHFDPGTEILSPIMEVEPASIGNRLNEMRCDRVGRLWVGSMRDYGASVAGSLYVIDPDLQVRRVLEDIRVPNSLVWSPDNRTMYFADTADNNIRRYDYDLASGAIGSTLPPIGEQLPGGPDGSAIDVEGYLWNARYGGGCVVRMSPDGQVVEKINLPLTQPAACTLGGPNLDTLYITTAKQRLDEEAFQKQPMAGHVFKVAVEVAGIPDANFRWLGNYRS